MLSCGCKLIAISVTLAQTSSALIAGTLSSNQEATDIKGLKMTINAQTQ